MKPTNEELIKQLEKLGISKELSEVYLSTDINNIYDIVEMLQAFSTLMLLLMDTKYYNYTYNFNSKDSILNIEIKCRNQSEQVIDGFWHIF
jgi:hypothetical protein